MICYAYVQPHHSKGHGESFALMWLNIDLSLKILKYILSLLQFHITTEAFPKTGVLILLCTKSPRELEILFAFYFFNEVSI